MILTKQLTKFMEKIWANQLGLHAFSLEIDFVISSDVIYDLTDILINSHYITFSKSEGR